MKIVLDTSAAIDIILRAPGSENLDRAVRESEWIEAPDLMIAEAANVCWKRHRNGLMRLEQCETMLTETIALPDLFIPAADLYSEAFALAVSAQRAVYDMFFLVLARRSNAVLVTIDKGLTAFAAQHHIKTLK